MDAKITGDHSDDIKQPVKMRKTIGLVNSITIIIGSMIGSGIFISPTGIMAEVQSFGASTVVWLGCGLFTLLGAYCYAELGTIIHRSGGDYAYHMEAFGPFFAFIRLWIEVMVARPATLAVIAITFAKYVFQPIFPDCEQSSFALRCLAAVCLMTITLLNCVSVRLSTHVQDIFTYAKVLALIMIIVTGIVRIAQGHTEELVEPFHDTNWNPGNFARAFYSGLFAYAGWNWLNCMIEEMKNPLRDLPIAIIFSCTVVTLINTMTNVAYLTVVSRNEMLTTPAVAVTFANRTFGPMWWVMPIFVACSCFGGINGSMLSASRIFYVASQEKQMPDLLSFLHIQRLTPIPAVMFTCFISLCYLCVEDIYSLMTYLGFAQWLAIGMTVFTMIQFRYTRRNVKRPVKAPLIFAIVYVVVTAFLVLFTFIGSPWESFLGVLIILAAIPVYIVGCVWKSKPKSMVDFMFTLTIRAQKLIRLAPGE